LKRQKFEEDKENDGLTTGRKMYERKTATHTMERLSEMDYFNQPHRQQPDEDPDGERWLGEMIMMIVNNDKLNKSIKSAINNMFKLFTETKALIFYAHQPVNEANLSST